MQSLHWRLGFGLLRTVGRLVGHYGAEAVSRGHRSTPFNRQQDRNRAENSVSHREVLLIQVAALEDVLDAQLDLPGRSGIRLQDPRDIISWRTRGRGGGIWAPGGISSDGRALFVATGNTIDAAAWSDGEAVIRLMPDLRHDVRTLR